MYPYINDIFHVQVSPSSAERARDASVRLHLRIVFLINRAKSSLVPRQDMTHLGAVIENWGDHQLTPVICPRNCWQMAPFSVGGLQQVVRTFAARHAMVPLCLFSAQNDFGPPLSVQAGE